MSNLRAGTILYGFCNGYFLGEDEYIDKRVEAFGADWIVARDSQGRVYFADFSSTEEMESLVKDWSVDHIMESTFEEGD